MARAIKHLRPILVEERVKRSRTAPTLRPADQAARMREVIRVLRRAYPDSQCSLTYATPFQLLAATILSAQCTDARVNQTTPELFRRFGTAELMARAKVSEIETLLKSINFFHNKAIALSEMSKRLVAEHGGEVPQDLDRLVELRGVGRKTANVVLGNAFGVPGLVVDTHVGRISRRLGMTKATDPVDVEHELMELVPREDWTDYAHLMIDHGRAVCTARRALCDDCPLAPLCPKLVD